MSSLRRFVPEPLKALRRHVIALGHLAEIRRRVEELDVSVAQLQTLLEELGAAPPPPRDLQVRVVGLYARDFLQSGRRVVADMEKILDRHALSLSAFATLLDFGCGCGRVLRCLPRSPEQGQERYGTDIDAEAISWCAVQYRRYARFSVNAPQPPLDFPDAFFDFVYSISIFTHLPEEMQLAWLRELQRVVKPGGYVLLSFHGENHFARLSARDRTRIEQDGFVYAETGQTAGLPAFYQTAWHSPSYVRRQWGEFFDVLEIAPVAISGHQDAALCRRRADP